MFKAGFEKVAAFFNTGLAAGLRQAKSQGMGAMGRRATVGGISGAAKGAAGGAAIGAIGGRDDQGNWAPISGALKGAAGGAALGGAAGAGHGAWRGHQAMQGRAARMAKMKAPGAGAP